MRYLIAALSILILSACGHTRLDYTPKAPPGMDVKRAASIVEQGFYEDYGKQKVQSAMVTEEFIALSNGTVSQGVSLSQAAIYGSALVGLGSTFITTRDINQRIYFRSVGAITVYKRNGRENRYAVIIRSVEQTTDRRIFFRSEARATEFADALEYLKQTLGSPVQRAGVQPDWQRGPVTKSREEQLLELQSQSLPYEQYMQRRKEILGE